MIPITVEPVMRLAAAPLPPLPPLPPLWPVVAPPALAADLWPEACRALATVARIAARAWDVLGVRAVTLRAVTLGGVQA